MITLTCKCGMTYKAREADIRRGWGKSCSKSCAAIKRTMREQSGSFRIAPASAKYRGRNRDFEPREVDLEDPSELNAHGDK